MHKPLQAHIEMETALATWTILEMLLHNSDFFIAQFPVDIKMKTGNGLHTIHKHPHSSANQHRSTEIAGASSVASYFCPF
jgi:hypothetical protein